MTSSFRFVFDTNILVSALFSKKSVPRKAFDKAVKEGEILVSLAVVDELNDVLMREKFNRYLKEADRIQFQIVLLQEATFIEITETIAECRDPKDNKFLELAVSGAATAIVSGDKDLLVLHPFRGIPILTPRSFMDTAWSD
ncbi:MAG: putative toxin-antitoxin system toxin component, PIN family [Anaerolineales bacterium]|nr:putative toxin-antitoxin system toxin component, PIN family [Anaerolineales bacterium]